MNSNADPTAGQARPPKPSALRVIPEALPPELKALPQWVIWRYFWQKNKWDKPPLQSHSGNPASHSSAKTWSDYAAALRAYHFDGSNLDGIGFVFHQDNGFVGIDLDDCRDPTTGVIEEWAQAAIDRFHTYTEISTSGTGVHLICKGTLPGRGVKTKHAEIYNHVRFFCVTGHVLEGTPGTIETPDQAVITEIYERLRASQAGGKGRVKPSQNGTGPTLDDDTIIQKALGARNGQKFAKLWAGEFGDYPSQSEADLALCRELVYWTEDSQQIDRIFRRSGLMRDKWDTHPTYAEDTITKAIETPHDHYSGVSVERNGQPHHGLGDERNLSSNSDEQPQEEPPPIHLTDRGNALRLVKAHGKDLHYIYRWKKWLVWDGTRWVVDEGNLVERVAKDVITQLYLVAQHAIGRLAERPADEEEISEDARKSREQQVKFANSTLKWALKSESAERLSGMLKHARSERGIAILPEQLDANPWILNCLNGTIDLKTGELYPHRRDDLCTKRLHIPYDKLATCPHWREQFLWRIMGGPKPDEEGQEDVLLARHERAKRLIGYLQRSVGYSLTGVIREQILQFMYGTGDNGKSTFSEVLAAMLGDYYQKAPQELLMRKARQQGGGPSPELARLCGVRLVIAQEIDEKHRLNEAQVKDLTGNDRLTARGLYEDYFEFNPTHKIWMYGNHKPVIVGTDDAIWKRPKLIPFTEKIPKTEQVTDLREKHLIPELPGIGV